MRAEVPASTVGRRFPPVDVGCGVLPEAVGPPVDGVFWEFILVDEHPAIVRTTAAINTKVRN